MLPPQLNHAASDENLANSGAIDRGAPGDESRCFHRKTRFGGLSPRSKPS
ncbi:hypothetical protein SynRS9915_01547 [Synechococcus sp. RS9915]|nr:hypothetical protein SynRS9915_01547 [Synechococcus sp. RS9915]